MSLHPFHQWVEKMNGVDKANNTARVILANLLLHSFTHFLLNGSFQDLTQEIFRTG